MKTKTEQLMLNAYISEDAVDGMTEVGAIRSF